MVDEKSCEQRKKWNRSVYKGESFLRFPASCLQCGAILWCLADIDESKEFVPVMGNHGVPLMQIIEPAQPRPEVEKP
jgi:hypothetical protein